MRNIALAIALLAGALVIGPVVPARADCADCAIKTQSPQAVVPQVCPDCNHERERIADGGGGHSDDRAAATRQPAAPGEERAVEGCAVIPEDLRQGAR